LFVSAAASDVMRAEVQKCHSLSSGFKFLVSFVKVPYPKAS
jgi:hypothetical protein